MNIEKIKNILSSKPIVNHEAFREYLKLVSVSEVCDTYTERHHICPVSMFDQYKNSNWNIVVLSYNNHVEAHRLLCEMYQNCSMKRAYSFMVGANITDKIRYLTSGAFKGDKNPSKRPEVRKKISQSKLGKERPDLKGKAFFGVSEESINDISKKISKKMSGSLIVKDSTGKRFRVRVDDPRYLSGELVPFNKGIRRGKRDPSIIGKIMATREKTYEKFSRFTYDEMVTFLYEASKSGKNIFGKHKPFSKNYSGFVKRTKYDPDELYKSVVQRLSKG